MSFCGTFVKNSTTGTQVISGVGFQAAAIIFWASGATSEGTWLGGYRQMIGFWCPGGNYAVCASATNAAATSVTARRFSNAPLTFCTAANALESEATLTIGAGGFTLNWTSNTASTGYIVHFLALSASEVTSAATVNWQSPAATGNHAVTGVGFTPNFCIHLTSGVTTASLPAGNTNAALSFGVTGPNITTGAATHGQWVASIEDPTGLARLAYVTFAEFVPTTANCINVIANGAGGTSDVLAKWISYDSSGFTLDFTAVLVTGVQIATLAIIVPQGYVDFFQKVITGAPAAQSITTPGFLPTASFLASAQKPVTSSATTLRLGLGAFDGTNSGATAIQSADLQATGGTVTNCNAYSSLNAFEVCDNDTPSVTASDVGPSFIGGGLGLSWNPNDTNATFMGYFIIAAASVVSASNFMCDSGDIGGATFTENVMI